MRFVSSKNSAIVKNDSGPYLYRVLLDDLKDLFNRFSWPIDVGLAADIMSKAAIRNDIHENPEISHGQKWCGPNLCKVLSIKISFTIDSAGEFMLI